MKETKIAGLAEMHTVIDGIGLKEDVDYGKIKFGNASTKPTLLKPGAEKITVKFNLQPLFAADTETLAMLGNVPGIIAFKCNLVERDTSIVVGEGRGAAKVGDKGRDANSTIKIAQKSAQIDAVLRVFALSDRFTQDLEDIAVEETKKIDEPKRMEEETKKITEPKRIEKQPAPNDGVPIIIINVYSKSGETRGKKWTRSTIVGEFVVGKFFDDNRSFEADTFEVEIADIAQKNKGTGVVLLAKFQQPAKPGFNQSLVKLEVAK